MTHRTPDPISKRRNLFLSTLCLCLAALVGVAQGEVVEARSGGVENDHQAAQVADTDVDGEGEVTRGHGERRQVTGLFSNTEDHRAAVLLFRLPALPEGQRVTEADVRFFLDDVVGGPSFNIDLWAVRVVKPPFAEFMPRGPGKEDYAIGDGPFENQQLLMRDYVTPDANGGQWLQLDQAGRATLGQYLQDRYAGGSYLAVRLTADVTPEQMKAEGAQTRYEFRGIHADYVLDGGDGTEPVLVIQTEDGDMSPEAYTFEEFIDPWTVPGAVHATWIGNSLPRGEINNDERSHVQHWIWGIEVSPDGRVYAGGGNESGHAISVFKDGDLESDFIPKADGSDGAWNWGTGNHGAVSFDDSHMYSVNTSGNAHKWERQPPYNKVRIMTPVGAAANEIVVRFNKMYLVAWETGEIQVRQLDDDFTLINRFTVEGAYDIAVDGENSIWVSMGGGSHGAGSPDPPLNEVRRYDAQGNRLPGTLDGFGDLMGIAIGHHQGRLIVSDDGPNKQVLFYDIADPANPTLVRRFGEPGGIYSGTRGVFDHDQQLFDVQDAGTDAEGNLYVLSSQSSFVLGETGGAMVRAYSPEGEKRWELSSELWTGTASVLPSTDGEEIYGVEEVFVLDPDADPANCDPDFRHGFCDPDWKLHAITYDDVGSPEDFRVVNRFSNRAFRGSAEIRELDGKRVIFRQNMGSGSIDGQGMGYDLLVFEDRPSMISHRRGRVPDNVAWGHAWHPDMAGNVWEGNAGGKIRMHKFGGFDADGAPIYDEYKQYDYPEWFKEVTRIFYDTENDVLYLSGYSEESISDDRWDYDRLPTNIAGTHLLRYDDWKAGNRQPSYIIELPWDESGRSLPPKTWYAAGDYIFTAPVRPSGGLVPISVFNANTGQFVGVLRHHQFGQLGWIDITRGLTAFKRANGEYIVIHEDNAYAKNVVYRWTPEPQAPDEHAINAGGPDYVATDGTSYVADRNFTGGSTFSVTDPIDGTGDDLLYQSERWGTFRYEIPVPDGTYDVTLQFAEIYFNQSGERVFDVRVEGDPAVTGLDIVSEAGGNFTAHDMTVTATVSDGALSLDFPQAAVNNAKLAALIVRPTGGGGRTGPASVNAHVFYNNSAFDGNDPDANAADDAAIATDKQPLLSGEQATFEHYTNYVEGINGIMLDVPDLPDRPAPEDFDLQTGNSADLADWQPGPAPSTVSVRSGAGVNGSDRITLIWPDQTFTQTWLRVEVAANARTGLAEPAVFYFGNMIGETGDDPDSANVNATDEIRARNHPRSVLDPAPVTDPHDFNRDRRVDATDQVIARNHPTNVLNALNLFLAP